MVHEQWGQLFQGVPVYGAGLSVHSNAAGEIVCVTGRLLPDVARTVTGPTDGNLSRSETRPVVFRDLVKLNAEAARRAALLAARVSSPLLAGHTLTSPGEPKLWLYNGGFVRNQPATVSRPAWEVKVLAAAEDLSETFFMDAGNGSVLCSVSGVSHATVREVWDCGDHRNNTTCYIDVFTDIFGPRFYYGRKEGQPPRGPNPNASPINGSTDVDWFYETGIPNLNSFLMTKFGRDGSNGVGGTVHPGTPPFTNETTSTARIYANADWSSVGQTACLIPGAGWSNDSSISFCRGNKFNGLIAHEFGHLVAKSMSFDADGTRNSLATTNESGALNESNSDILGESFEKFITGINDWVFNGEIGGERIMSQPSSKTDSYLGNTHYPDSFHSPDFYCGTLNSGGIHHNSTVPSHAAYLASEGGAFNGC